MKTVNHQVDVAVIGGGLAGIAAALAAARHGVKVALLHDRPVLGGASSSEMRVHIGGADSQNPNMRETGILEELRLENLRRNPQSSYSIWDTVLYEKVRFQPGLKLFLNTSCFQAETEAGRIKNVTGWQLTTETKHVVFAKVFVDCSGDGILAPLTGASWRQGREARIEFNEAHAPNEADGRTMGMTCLFQARPTDFPQPFEPPEWAYDFPEESDLPYGEAGHRYFAMGYWWLEMGGEKDAISDAEIVRDELIKIV
ncbi:MAG: FAD-dependent oxidoreductase, partial [Candidatus Omnitrophica bacterium]|nr:FAD-dependent oxidoreductase [Candidatus Omnitrophota bacterium]